MLNYLAITSVTRSGYINSSVSWIMHSDKPQLPFGALEAQDGQAIIVVLSM